MEELLLEKLYRFIVHNNPDLLVTLQGSQKLADYMEQRLQQVKPQLAEIQASGKPAHIIEDKCMDVLTAELRPSRFHYIRAVLEAEFETAYYRYVNNGSLTYQVISLMEECNPVFDDFGFSEENQHHGKLRTAITNTIRFHLQND